MFRHLAGASALLLILAGAAAAQDHDHDHEDVTLYRVFVGDHEKGQVTAFDLSAPDHRWTFPTTGQAKLYSVAGGAVVAAVQSDADTVQFIQSGISLHDHGDHRDIEVVDPAAIDASLTGPRPFHLVDHDGKVVLNYDNGGYAEILDGAALAEGKVEPVKFPQARAHHGFVAPLGATGSPPSPRTRRSRATPRCRASACKPSMPRAGRRASWPPAPRSMARPSRAPIWPPAARRAC